MIVKARLHRPFDKVGGKTQINMLYETGNENAEFIINGSLKFEANKAGSFEFDILPAHPCYSLIRRYRSYISVTINEDDEMWVGDDDWSYIDDGIVFYGRILSITMSFNRVKHVVCEGLLANLVDAPMYNDLTHDPGTLSELDDDGIRYIMYHGASVENPTNNVIAIDDETTEVYKVTGDANLMWLKAGDSYRNITQRSDIRFIGADISSEAMDDIDVYGGQSVGDFITGELVGIYGGFLKMNYLMDNSFDVFAQLSWIKDPTMDGFEAEENGQPIEFGKNLLDLSAEYVEDNVVNGVCVAWTTKKDEKKWRVKTKSSLTVDSFEIPKEIEVPAVYNAKVYDGVREAATEFIEVPGISTQSKAISYAMAYAKKFCNYELDKGEFDSYTVKAVDRHFIDDITFQEIKLYDQVRLISSPHEVDKAFTCTSIEYSLDNPLVRSYTLQIYRPKPSSNEKVLSKQIGKKIKYADKESVSSNKVTEKISG